MKITVRKGYKLRNMAIHLNGLCVYSHTVRESFREQSRYACEVYKRVHRKVNTNVLLNI